jgi:hypothetical protein
MDKCGFVPSARLPSSTPEDRRTGQDLLTSKDVETYERFYGMKGRAPYFAVMYRFRVEALPTQ